MPERDRASEGLFRTLALAVLVGIGAVAGLVVAYQALPVLKIVAIAALLLGPRKRGAIRRPQVGVTPRPASSVGRGREVPPRPPKDPRRPPQAPHVAAVGRMSSDERTRPYVAGRTKEGVFERETVRCAKRHIAREVHRSVASAVVPPASFSAP